MKTVIIFALAIVTTLAAPANNPDQDAVIVKYENENIGIDGYNFAFETSNGIARSEAADVRNLGTDQESLAVRGTISWIDDKGEKFTLDFVADENGFQPVGAHLPK